MFIKKLNFIWIPRKVIPSEYRKLLDHEEPTTLRLEALSKPKQKMYVTILEESFSDKIYEREIVMLGKKDHIPRELAYIKIFMENLPEESIHREIIDKKKPFGKVLSSARVKTSREGMAFFQVYKAESIARHLVNSSNIYYGRKYSIFLVSEKKKLAEVIEIYSSPEKVSRQIK